jgi:uncharacterized protein YybS (DUF2232 family)
MSKDLATGIGVTCLAVAVCAVVPIAGLIGSAFIPVPLVFFRAKLGRHAAQLIALAGFGCAVLLGGHAEVLFFGELLLIGLVMGELLARQWPLEKTVAAVCVAVLIVGLGALLVFSLGSGEGLLATLSEGIRYHLELSLQLYRQMGLSQDQLHFLESSMEGLQLVLVGMMPALVIASTLMVAWISLLVARRLCQRHGLPFPDYGALDRWKAPELMVWGVIGSGALLLLPVLAAKLVGLNGLVVFMVIYFFQGMAVVAFWFQKKQVPRLARMALYALIAVQQLVMLAVIGVGFFDTWFNFRKIGKPLAPS